MVLFQTISALKDKLDYHIVLTIGRRHNLDLRVARKLVPEAYVGCEGDTVYFFITVSGFAYRFTYEPDPNGLYYKQHQLMCVERIDPLTNEWIWVWKKR